MPLLVRKFNLHRFGRLVGAEGLAQQVEARAGEVGIGFEGLRNDLSLLVDDQDVVDSQQLLVLDHLGVGRLKADVVLCDECQLVGFRLVDGVELLGVLGGFLLGRLKQAREFFDLLLDFGAAALAREVILHTGE